MGRCSDTTAIISDGLKAEYMGEHRHETLRQRLQAQYKTKIYKQFCLYQTSANAVCSLNGEKPLHRLQDPVIRRVRVTFTYICANSGSTVKSCSVANNIRVKSFKLVLVSFGQLVLEKRNNFFRDQIDQRMLPVHSHVWHILAVLQRLIGRATFRNGSFKTVTRL